MTQDVTTISLEPFLPTKDGRDRPVLRYDPETGKPFYKEKRPATAKFDEAVTEVILLKPGKFSDVTIDNVHQFKSFKEVEETIEKEETEDPEEQDLAVKKDVQQRKELSAEEMGRMRHEVSVKLHAAWLQMMKTSEIIRSLIPAQPHPYVSPEHAAQHTTIPPHAFDIIPSRSQKPPPKDILTALDVKKMVLARNRKGLADAQEGLVTRATEMRARMKGEHEYWDDLKRLAGFSQPGTSSSGSSQTNKPFGADQLVKPWSLRPRWRTDNGVPPENQIATDVMIPYAADEAGPAFRAIAIATIDPPADSLGDSSGHPKMSTIRMPSRRRRRLRLCIRTAGDPKKSWSYSTVNVAFEEEDEPDAISRSLEAAGEEVFEEEMFNEIRIEAKNNATLNARISVDSVVISAVPEQELVFELVDLDDLEDETDGIPLKGSAKADLILSIIKMSMFRLYRSRKRNKGQEPEAQSKSLPPAKSTTGPTKSIQPNPNVTKTAEPPTLLGTLVPYLYYQAFLRRLLGILADFQEIISSFGLRMGIKRKDSGEVGGLNWDGLLGRAGGMEDGSIDVTLEDRQIVSLTISSSSTFTLVFPSVYLPSSDMTQLPSYIAREMRQCLVDMVEQRVMANMKGTRINKIGKDHLAGSVSTPKTRIVINMGSTMANTTVKALVLRRQGDTDSLGQEILMQRVEELVFDGAGQDKGQLLDWVDRMVSL